MNTSGEAADQVVRMSLEVGEAALKISGTGAEKEPHIDFHQSFYQSVYRRTHGAGAVELFMPVLLLCAGHQFHPYPF